MLSKHYQYLQGDKKAPTILRESLPWSEVLPSAAEHQRQFLDIRTRLVGELLDIAVTKRTAVVFRFSFRHRLQKEVI